MAQKDKSVKISARRYRELRKVSKANGPTITWQINYAIDLYLQEVEQKANASTAPIRQE